MHEIIKEFGRNSRRTDPVLHFYETFLAAYDPALREARGVYYTPEPVVDYIVKSVDHLLKKDFKLEGLADESTIEVEPLNDEENAQAVSSPSASHMQAIHVPKVQILDPATGTGTFLHGIIQHVYNTRFAKNQGMWPGFVREHLIPRLHGFEFLIAPYAIAYWAIRHIPMSHRIQDSGLASCYAARIRKREKIPATTIKLMANR